ncbi:MAG: carboxynorspermidine decarboxylase [Pseudomonadota bacterium]
MSETADSFARFDPGRVPSPCFVLDLAKLEDNLRILQTLSEQSGAKVLLALKAFSCFAVADLVSSYLHGTAASGLWEARLGATRYGGEVHTFAPGLKAGELAEVAELSDHLIFNSVGQFERFGAPAGCAAGLRINPRHSEVETALYDPCGPWSRLGATAEALGERVPEGISGLHVHALCDQGYEPFDRLLAATEAKFAAQLEEVSWLNLGGGQLLTSPDYPVDRLAERLRALKDRTGLELYLEPGTAVALNAGVLVTEVLDKGAAEGHFAIMDASATCHMPDVIEAPYTPDVMGAETVEIELSDDPCVIRLGGPTCLAGDVIGTYRFDRPLEVGQRLMIADQAYYTMVKATTFNGTPLPAIALWDSRTDQLEMVRSFGYEDFEARLS